MGGAYDCRDGKWRLSVSLYLDAEGQRELPLVQIKTNMLLENKNLANFLMDHQFEVYSAIRDYNMHPDYDRLVELDKTILMFSPVRDGTFIPAQVNDIKRHIDYVHGFQSQHFCQSGLIVEDEYEE